MVFPFTLLATSKKRSPVEFWIDLEPKSNVAFWNYDPTYDSLNFMTFPTRKKPPIQLLEL